MGYSDYVQNLKHDKHLLKHGAIFLALTIFKCALSGIDHIHNVMQPSTLFAKHFRLPKQKLRKHGATTPHSPPHP